RVRAIKKLFERQQKYNFLFMLTLNVRDDINDELISYLEGAQREVLSQELKDILSWYANCGKGKKNYRLKAVVPLFVRREAERSGFDCFCYPPLAYESTRSEYSTIRSHMVHFVF